MFVDQAQHPLSQVGKFQEIHESFLRLFGRGYCIIFVCLHKTLSKMRKEPVVKILRTTTSNSSVPLTFEFLLSHKFIN